MLKCLLIQNFQKHEKLKIEFDERITTISGPSDAGKSSILRALKWVCLNNPQGEAFIRKGSKGTTVQLFVDDSKIGRKRSKSLNAYYLDNQEFKAFGQDVPDTISSILKMDEINFQGQQDAPFWFSLSAGEVSRQLNSVIDLEILDHALSAIGKKVRHFQSITQISKERLKTFKTQKKELDWIRQADTTYCSVENLKERQTFTAASVDVLSNLMVSIKNKLEIKHRRSSQLKSLGSIGILGRYARRIDVKRISLSELIIGIKKQQKILDKGKPDTSKLDFIVEEYNKIEGQAKRLQQIIRDLKLIQNRISNLIIEQKNADKELEEQTEGICPICGGEL